ncbi:nucleotidyltransferase domain-containing protein [Stenotrophomonas sp.]|uniref:nucleotidyltransferase domain-containing protein n=1 Tax=Stenotrophomonas sp. TaxID=69392 RepID=UPI0028B1DA53|nr:nucleotidyltransferase domain-containing protein [Stenotrophomonas sp.]
MNPLSGTDDEGFILSPPAGDLQEEFGGVVADTSSSLVKTLGCTIDGIYLYGSVAWGRATPGVSDLDVTLVINNRTEVISAQLEQIRLLLQTRHPEVTKIDFDVGIRSEVLAIENVYRWGYWLKHQCRSVWGADLSEHFRRFKPSRRIALDANGDFVSELHRLAKLIEQESNSAQLRSLQREAARKAIRATNVLRAEHGGDWPLTLSDYATSFIRAEPGMRTQASYFLRNACAPQACASEFAARLNDFAQDIARLQRSRTAKGSGHE